MHISYYTIRAGLNPAVGFGYAGQNIIKSLQELGHKVDFANPIALVFGNEHSGVSEEIRAMADGNFVIPQVGVIQSLNISVACAVTLYEAFRQKEIAGHYQRNPQEGAARLQLLKDWELE